MSDQAKDTQTNGQDTQAMSPEMLQQMIQQAITSGQTLQTPAPAPDMNGGGMSGWQRPKPAAANLQDEKILLPIRLETSEGIVKVQLQLDGAAAFSAQMLLDTIEGMIAAGLPVDAWRSKKKSSW